MNTKFFPLSSRSKTTALKQPKELTTYGRTIEGDYVYESEQVQQNLSYFYLPDADINSGIDLSGGFKKFLKIEEEKNLGEFESLLHCIMKYEQKSGSKMKADIITFRGLMTKILTLPYNLKDPIDFNIVFFDDQLFIKSDDDIELKRRQSQMRDIKNPEISEKLSYSGYKFEAIAMLPKPWADCSRQLIEKRNKKIVNNFEQYLSVVRSGIGKIKVVMGGEIDGVWDYKPDEGKDPLPHYIELKTSRCMSDTKQLLNFERKLFKTWAQCFLMGIRKIVYGFRDENLILRHVEEYKTEEVPLLLKNNPFTVQNKNKLSCTDALKWYGAVLDWLVKEIPKDDTKSWRLSFDPSTSTLSLSEVMPDMNKKLRNGEILSSEFKEWRESLKSNDA